MRLRDFQSRKNIGIVWYVFTGYADFSFFVVDVETGGSNSPMQFHTILIRCTRLPSMRSGSVSYTHLDVYKRQVLCCAGEKVIDRALKILNDVDVYKRQDSYC